MRIVHLLEHSRQASGHVEAAVDLACQQARLGHEVLFVAGAGHFAQILARHGVAFIEMPDESRWRIMALLRDLAFVLRRTRPDIVHAHMAASAFLAWLLRPLAGYRLVTTLHDAPGRARRLLLLGDRVITVSDAMAQALREQGVTSHKLRMVSHGSQQAHEAPGSTERMARDTIAVYHEARASGRQTGGMAPPQGALPQ